MTRLRYTIPLVLVAGLLAGSSFPSAVAQRSKVERPEDVERMLDLVRKMRDVSFDPETAALIAIGGLKDEVRRKDSEVIEDLERLLETTRSPGIRNAIRLTLKDLYKKRGDNDKALKHLRQIVIENDRVIQRRTMGRGPLGRGIEDRWRRGDELERREMEERERVEMRERGEMREEREREGERREGERGVREGERREGERGMREGERREGERGMREGERREGDRGMREGEHREGGRGMREGDDGTHEDEGDDD